MSRPTQLLPAEHLQAEPAREHSDYWLGFICGAFTLGFWAAVAFGTGVVVIGGR